MVRMGLVARVGGMMGAALTSAVLLGGCDAPTISPFAVSGDDKYVAFSVDERGHIEGLNNDDPSTVVIYDTGTHDISKMFGVASTPGFLSTDGKVVSYNTANGDGESPIIVINSGTRINMVKDAYVGDISDDGRYLAFTKDVNPGQELNSDKTLEDYELYLMDLRSREETSLGISGFVPRFSPNSRSLVYLAGDKDNHGMDLWIYDRLTKDEKRIASLELDKLNKPFLPEAPSWVDNETVMFQTKNSFTGKDSEIFLVNMDNEMSQVTDNSLYEASAQMFGGNVYYTAASKLDEPPTDLYVATKEDGKWTSKEIDLNASYIAIAGDNLIHAVDGSCVFMTPLEKLVEDSIGRRIISPFVSNEDTINISNQIRAGFDE